MLPAAPGLFSITTCLPSISLTRCMSRRPTTSVAPPAGKPTTALMVRSGQGAWARAGEIASATPAATAPRRPSNFMVSSL